MRVKEACPLARFKMSLSDIPPLSALSYVLLFRIKLNPGKHMFHAPGHPYCVLAVAAMTVSAQVQSEGSRSLRDREIHVKSRHSEGASGAESLPAPVCGGVLSQVTGFNPLACGQPRRAVLTLQRPALVTCI